MTNTEKVTTVDPLDEARALLEAEEQKARHAFAIEINELCKKHGFNLQVKYEIVAVKI